MKPKITDVEKIILDVPYHQHPGKEMARQLWRGQIIVVWRVETDAGITGFGEGSAYRPVSDEPIARMMGRNPFELLWDDSLGKGPQMALFDLAGKALEVPCYRLMGHKLRNWCPISWWGIDMPAEDFALEAQEAVRSGYTSFKMKARPWFDIFDQVEAVSKVTPPHFKLDLDFNRTLLNPGKAIPIMKELERFPKVAIFEGPIEQWDIEGNLQIRKHIGRPIAMHYGVPPIMTALKEDVCEGFVISGGAKRVLDHAAVAAQANKPFWLQLTGTGLTTLFAAHLGAVLSHARWPAVTITHLYSNDLLAEPLEVKGGYIRVPEEPGLGIAIDEEVLERFRVESTEKPGPEDLYAVIWPDGRRTLYATALGSPACYNADFLAGNEPIYERGVRMETIPNDGSKEFAELRARALREPVREKQNTSRE